MDENETIACPFCVETAFDAIGLKNHLLSGHCKIFDETISIEQERHLTSQSRAAEGCTCQFMADNRIVRDTSCPRHGTKSPFA